MRLSGRRTLRTSLSIPPSAWVLARMATVLVAALAALPATAATVEVLVEGADPGASVSVALCQGGLSEEACSAGQETTARGGAVTVVFRDVTAGRYAVAAFEDVNGNRRLDRTGLGLPMEPYGFSGGAGLKARPTFAEAAFDLREPGSALRVRLARALPRR
ncbi:hypothetical protein AFCDBAGC_2293 [Methylobacterium cerastii]|uniref:DUF2141 domain-containing protein n=2 Tax=Methylobacteriaceae TaxID=119045 RepID=A0ABQ4QHC6_9HYPH|nr:hypothetical protein AFCDBAGC_2293 [Methylobacterium cerastii]